MKFHVFIATTQGLVAIQDVIPLNDPDIHSLISVNGTATVANISTNYHHFVKKGSGLIHQDFSCCSYRINISKGIDQGNSWQLGIYLAHLLSDQNLLACGGEIEENDQILIATGEVNTTSRNVQSIQHVQEKYNHIIRFYSTQKQLTNIPAPVLFLPEANLSSLNHNVSKNSSALIDIVGVEHLSELQTKIVALTAGTLNNINNTKNVRKKKYLGLTSISWLMVFSMFVGVFFLVFFLGKPDSQIKTQLSSVQPEKERQKNAISKSDRHNKQAIKQHNIARESDKIRLEIIKATYNDCAEQTYQSFLLPETNSFPVQNRHKLCQMSLITSDHAQQVFWLDNNKSTLLALKESNALLPESLGIEDQNQNQNQDQNKNQSEDKKNRELAWLVPLPLKQQRDVSYYFIVLFNESPEFKQRLNTYLSKDIKSPKVSYKAITTWLNQHYADSELYQHTLEVF